MAPPRLLEVLTKAASHLREKGVPNSRLDAELLLARVLGIRRIDLYLQFDRPLVEQELESYRGFIRRRARREPLQHIEGEVAFRELRLRSDRRALVPRPETELLVDVLKRRLPAVDRPRVVDLGVGSGALALSVAREIPGARVTASDISPLCLDLTRENAVLNALPEPELFLGSLFEPFPPDCRWDAVISNPPYIGEKEIPLLQPEVRDYDPSEALFGGPEGWELPQVLLEQAFRRLEPGGILVMEISPSHFPRLREKAQQLGWMDIHGFPDYQQNIRFFTAKFENL